MEYLEDMKNDAKGEIAIGLRFLIVMMPIVAYNTFVDPSYAEESFHFKVTCPLSIAVVSLVSLVLLKMYPSYLSYFPTVFTVCGVIISTEKNIIKDPE